MINTNNMNKVALFEKMGTIDDVKKFREECIKSKLFTDEKCANLDKVDMLKNDFKIVESNVEGFLTVWSRHPRNGKKTKEIGTYGVRIKREMMDRIPAIGVMYHNINETYHNEDTEIRLSVSTLDDVKFIITKILAYSQAHSVNRQSKEVATVKATIA